MAEPEQPQEEIRMVSPPRGYVNFAAGQGGPLELSLTLGYRQGDAPPIVVAPIVVAWEFVPVLIRLLQDQLDSYQEQVGTIRNVADEHGRVKAAE